MIQGIAAAAEPGRDRDQPQPRLDALDPLLEDASSAPSRRGCAGRRRRRELRATRSAAELSRRPPPRPHRGGDRSTGTSTCAVLEPLGRGRRRRAGRRHPRRRADRGATPRRLPYAHRDELRRADRLGRGGAGSGRRGRDARRDQLADVLRRSAATWTRRASTRPPAGGCSTSRPRSRARRRSATPQEPNDDVRLVAAGGLFASGIAPLTSARAHERASRPALVDGIEDRPTSTACWVPPGSDVVAMTASNSASACALGAGTGRLTEDGRAGGARPARPRGRTSGRAHVARRRLLLRRRRARPRSVERARTS